MRKLYISEKLVGEIRNLANRFREPYKKLLEELAFLVEVSKDFLAREPRSLRSIIFLVDDLGRTIAKINLIMEIVDSKMSSTLRERITKVIDSLREKRNKLIDFIVGE